jgi:hypothetical protein
MTKLKRLAKEFANPDDARELGRRAQMTTKASLAYMAEATLEVSAALVQAAVDGDIRAMKLLLEITGVKPLRYRSPEDIDRDLEDVDGDPEELEAILRDAQANQDGNASA